MDDYAKKNIVDAIGHLAMVKNHLFGKALDEVNTAIECLIVALGKKRGDDETENL